MDQCVQLQCRRMDRLSYRPVWGTVRPVSLRHHANNCFYNSRYSRTKQQSYQNCFRQSRFLNQISGIWGFRTLFQLLQAHAQSLKCAAAYFHLGTVQSGYEMNDRTMSDRTSSGAETFLFCTACSAAVRHAYTLPPDVYRGFSREKRGRRVKLTTSLHAAIRLTITFPAQSTASSHTFPIQYSLITNFRRCTNSNAKYQQYTQQYRRLPTVWTAQHCPRTLRLPTFNQPSVTAPSHFTGEISGCSGGDYELWYRSV